MRPSASRTERMPRDRAALTETPATVQTARTVPHISARLAVDGMGGESGHIRNVTPCIEAPDARVSSGISLKLRRPSCSTGSGLGLGTHCLGSSDWLPSISFTAPLTSNSDTPSTVLDAATHLGVQPRTWRVSAGVCRLHGTPRAQATAAHALGTAHREAAAQAGVPHEQRIAGAHACGLAGE